MHGSTRPRVVIIGTGFGGLAATHRLAHAPLNVTVADRTNHHLFAPLLYQVATGVTVATHDGATERISACTVIWTADVQASALGRLLGAAAGVGVDHKGRVMVNPDCALPGHPRVFAIGDVANHDDLPGLAEPAMQQGQYVARRIRAAVAGQAEPGPFRYRDLGTMATIAPADAIADVFGLKLSGVIGKLAWAGVHLAFLAGWGNRAGVLARWAAAASSR